MYDPKNDELILSGKYKNPFWIVKLKILKEENKELTNECNLASVNENLVKCNYNTRSKATEGEVEINDEIEKNLNDCKSDLLETGKNRKIHKVEEINETNENRKLEIGNCNAEYVAMSDTCREMLSLHNSVKLILSKELYPMTIYCDNAAAILCASADGTNKLRHMVERRKHYIKECVKNDYIKIVWVKSRDQLADIFTKALGKCLHVELTNKIFNVKND